MYVFEDLVSELRFEMHPENWTLGWRMITFFLHELTAFFTDQRVYRSLDFEFRERDTNDLVYSGFFGLTNGIRGKNIDSIETVSVGSSCGISPQQSFHR